MRKRRMRKVLVFGIFFILFGAMVIINVPWNVSAPDAWPGTPVHLVDPTSLNPMAPYTTPNTAAHFIQDAIDASWVGDTIKVYAGTYKGKIGASTVANIKSTHNNLILISVGYKSAVINGSALGVPKICVSNKADGVTIRFFEIKDGAVGLSMKNVDSCKISNNYFTNNDNGLSIHNCKCTALTKNKIESNNFINNNDDSIELHATDVTKDCKYNNFLDINITQTGDTAADGAICLSFAEHNTFDDVEISQNLGGDGLYLTHQSNSNTIKNSNIQKTRYGISIGSSATTGNNCQSNIVQYNSISNNREAGINIYKSYVNTIEENTITNTGSGTQKYGIKLVDSMKNTIQNHEGSTYEISKNINSGIYLEDCSKDVTGWENLIKDNKIYKNTGYGIHLRNSINAINTVSTGYNDIYDNSFAGIYIESSDDTAIKGNMIRRNTGTQNYGIKIYNSKNNLGYPTNPEIIDNIIKLHINDGIYVDSSTDFKISENEIFDNSDDGIFLLESDANTIEKNKIYNSGTGTQENGIHLYDSEDNIIQNHKTIGSDNWGISYNKDNGIFLEECVDSGTEVNCIQGNHVFNNEDNGIYLLLSDNNKMIKDPTTANINIIHDNGDDGIYLEGSDGNIIEENIICNEETANQKNGITIVPFFYPPSTYITSDSNKICYNEIYENIVNGIKLGMANSNEIKGNNIYDNQYDGIDLDFSSYNIIKENEIQNKETTDQDYGIHLNGEEGSCVDNEIINNNVDKDSDSVYGIHNNNKDGIFIEYCEDSGTPINSIKGNEIHENGENGIQIKDSAYADVIKDAPSGNLNKIYNNNIHGIFLKNSNHITIEKNDIFDNNYDNINDDSGIYLESSNDNTIQKNKIYNSVSTEHQKYGIHIRQSMRNVITNHKTIETMTWGIYNNRKDGILIDDCDISADADRNEVTLNYILDNDEVGIHIKNSENAISTYSASGENTIERTLTNTQKMGIYLEDSESITLQENNMIKCGIWITGDIYDYWNTHTIDTSNTVNTYEVQYLKNIDLEVETVVDDDAGEVILANSNNVVVKDQSHLNEGTVGILLGFTTNSRIESNICNSNNFYGICLYTSSHSNIIYNNEVKFNCDDGIFINDESDNNMIRNNRVIDNDDNGIYLYNSDNNIIENNDFEDNTNYGIKIVASAQNSVFHNNFKNNNGGNVQAYDNTGTNYFDNRNLCSGNGYPEGGNYWDDFETAIGTPYDDFQGENQEDSNTYGYGDGIIDQGPPSGGQYPYDIDGSAGADDEYPLMDEVINGRVQRPPIRIDSDADFDAEHGVTSGTGTSNDPYIIEGWDIDGTGYGFCLFIGNTTSYFIVRNCRFHHASGAVNKCPWYQNAGITLYNVVNGKITADEWNNGKPHSLEIGHIITKPTICEFNVEGILLTGDPGKESFDNIIENCIIEHNYNSGIYLLYSHDNTISYNQILSNNEEGIYLQWDANNNIITNNLIKDNLNNGIEINIEDPAFKSIYFYSYDNEIYHNNFINNNNTGTIQAYDHQDPLHGSNTWFFGYPEGGNYWDDFDESSENAYDDYQGTNQNILNTYNLGDGIVDKGQGQSGGKNPYNIAGQAAAQDEYPLINELVEGRVQRPPIRIDTNTDFDAAHGVIDGSGTSGDPYIIEGWGIDGSNYRYCLYIGNTTNYFKIQDSCLHDAGGTSNPPFYPNAGIILYNTQNGVINDNTISDNYKGIYLTNGAQSNTITDNTISDNTNYGVEIKGSSSDYNSIYHNNFIDNNNGGTQAYDECNNNQWDNGYPSGGNFWSDWLEPDEYSGPNQDQSNPDGIVDQPYNITGSANAKDNYPKTRYF